MGADMWRSANILYSLRADKSQNLSSAENDRGLMAESFETLGVNILAML